MSQKEAFNAWWEENHDLVSSGQYTTINKKFTAYKAWEAGVNFAISAMNGLIPAEDDSVKMPEEFRKAWLEAVEEKRIEDETRALGNFSPKKIHGAQSNEPAASMQDDSPRMMAIGQNGNNGEHYE